LLRTLGGDGLLLLSTRFIRLFAYGALSIVLVFYLQSLGLTEPQTGLLLTLTLAGDTAISLFLTTRADRLGRRRVLIAGAVLMLAAGLVFAFTRSYLVLLIAATVGVISPSGNEVGPFLPIEQAALSQVLPAASRTSVFAWYTLAGSFATALGSMCGGLIPDAKKNLAATPVAGYRAVVLLYASIGIVLAILFSRLSRATEIAGSSEPSGKNLLGLTHSRAIVLKLSGLFALDAFGGAFVVQTFAVYWFYLRFGENPAILGSVFFGANFFAGISALAASKLASRFGLVRTMVFTHLPSNVLLLLVPLMPTFPLAVACLLLRFSISQMDVPTRQSYMMAVVQPEERSAAAGVTGVARTVGASIPPALVGIMFANPSWINLPFYLAGGLKIVYDLLLYRAFVNVRPSEESTQTSR
jgi:MFS family permease